MNTDPTGTRPAARRWSGLARAALALTLLLGTAAPARGADVVEGTVRITREPERTYGSLALALGAARDGDVLELGPGTFPGAVVIAGKDVRVRGAGAGRTQLTAGGTVLQVAADARAHVSGLSVVSRGGESFAPAVLATGDGFRLEECVVEGASGFGVEVRSARHDIELFGNTIRRNAGGGVRFSDAVGRVHDNVIVDNGGPGLLIDGEPPAGGLVRVEHNTIVRNLVRGEAVAAAVPGGPDAAVSDALQHRLIFDWNVASGRLPETLLAPESATRLQQRNVLLWPDRLEDVFEDVEQGDYRPDDALPVDPAGLELGALLSDDGRERLGPALDAALAEGRLGDALTLARRAAEGEREPLWERIRAALYAGYVKHVDAKHLGLAVRDFFLAIPGAPAGWNVRDRFEQAISRIGQAYAAAIDWSGVFADDATLRPMFAELLAEGRVHPGRPATGSAGTGWIVTGQAAKAPLVDRRAEPLQRTLTLDNPEHANLQSTLEIERSRRTRLDDQRRRVAEEVAAYEAKGGAFLAAKRRELDRLSQSLVESDTRLRQLEETAAQVSPTYNVTVNGQVEIVSAMGEVALRLTDAVGRVHEETVPLRREETFLALDPLPLLGFDGIPARTAADDREQARYARELVEKTLVVAVNVIEARDIERMAALAQAASAGRATLDDQDELYALLVVYADRFRDAIQAERPAAELRVARDRSPDIDQPRFQLAYDPSLARKPPLVFTVETSAARRQAERLLADLELRHAAYWALLSDLRTVFDRLGGLPLEEFLELVAVGGAG